MTTMLDAPRLVQIVRPHVPAAILLLVIGGVMLATVPNYGVTWDEDVQATYGEKTLDYFLTLGADTSGNDFHNLRYYGPAFELLTAVAHRIIGGDRFLVRHVIICIAAWLTLVAVYVLGTIIADPWTGVWAVLALTMTPRFYGHAFNNPKDIPFACAFAWAMVAFACILTRPRLSARMVIGAGLAIGTALAIRVGGLLLFGYLAIPFLLHAWLLLAGGSARPRDYLRPGLKAIAIAVVAWALMVAFWPWAHQSPILNPWRAFLASTQFEYTYPVLFAGEIFDSTELPRHYVVEFLLITTPLPAGILVLVGIARASFRLARPSDPEAFGMQALLLSWVAIPLAYTLAARPNVYGGVRHFLFVLPGLAMLTAVGAAALQERWRLPRTRRAITIALFAALLWPLGSMVTLHPYQTTYFNELVGGTGGASERYDTEYWSASYKEAATWIARDGVRLDSRPLHVVVAANTFNIATATHYLPADALAWPAAEPGVVLPRRIDYYIGMTKFGAAKTFLDLPIVYRVERDGALFAVVRAAPHLAARHFAVGGQVSQEVPDTP